MPKASKSFPEIGKRDEPLSDMGFRSLEVRAKSLNEETRSVEAVISTENPVPMPDWARGEMIPEVLLASGAQYPKNRQVPFLDSHNRYSIKDQLGSVREITVADGQITARLYFAKASHAEDAYTGVREGHITDVSVGYQVLKRQYVAAGETKTISGRAFDGPVNVVTRWRLQEVSLTPIGADAQAKLRGLDPAAVRFQSSDERQFAMNEELRKLLVSRGMPATHNDEEAQRWLLDNPGKLAEQPQPKQEEQRSAAIPSADEISKLIQEGARKAIEQERAARAAFTKQVDEICELAEVPELAPVCREYTDLDAVRAKIKEEKAARAANVGYSPSVRVTGTGFERLQTDIRSALALNAVRATGVSNDTVDRVIPVAERSKTADNFRHATLFDMATEYVRASGINPFGLTREQVAICAMFGPEKAGIRGQRSEGPYHTTGSFANLTLDAINKSMMVGYTEVPATWRGPMRQGVSVPDFKNINRVRIGAIPNLPVWNDADEPNTASMADAKETYAVEAYSLKVPFSYKLIVNDDMSALSRVPQALGDAAARTVNAAAWAQITSNPTMSDGVSLFSAATGNRKKQNTTTGSVSDYTAQINALTALMMTMTGENTPENNAGADILGLMPRYLVFPAALRGTLLQLVASEYDPKASVAGIRNINTGLVPVMEPLLDAASTTAWYLFAEPTRVDTVEVTFLQGQETPVVRSEMDGSTLAMEYYVLQSFGAKALNHRGIQRHTGA